MNDKPASHSGSRWEPAEPAPTPPATLAGEPTPTEGRPAAPPSRSRRFSPRGRGALVAAATAIVALSGAGGYLLGHAADGTDQVGLVGNGAGGGQGQLPGTPPGLGQNGVRPGHDDQDFDDDTPGVPPGGSDDGSDSDDDSGSDDGSDSDDGSGSDHGSEGRST